MNFFFVFQNKSYTREYSGNYLWAPKHDKKGNPKSHWKSMQSVKAGDVIFSSVNQEIRAIAVAQKDCMDAISPLGEYAELWEKDGYRVEVKYHFLEKPLSIDGYRNELVHLMPSYNAPLNRTGKSNTGYLFNINEDVSDYLMNKIKETLSEEEFYELYSDIFGQADDGESEIIEELSIVKIDDVAPTSVVYKPQDKKGLVAGKDNKPRYPRDINVAINALKLAEHKCEYNNEHPTFVRKKDGKPYTEPHHLIPLSKHSDFDVSLDVEANIVSLCSNCHNQLHYGAEVEKMLEELFNKRKDLLKSVGIEIEFSELLGYYS
jgi:hypothetical protein